MTPLQRRFSRFILLPPSPLLRCSATHTAAGPPYTHTHTRAREQGFARTRPRPFYESPACCPVHQPHLWPLFAWRTPGGLPTARRPACPPVSTPQRVSCMRGAANTAPAGWNTGQGRRRFPRFTAARPWTTTASLGRCRIRHCRQACRAGACEPVREHVRLCARTICVAAWVASGRCGGEGALCVRSVA